MRAIVSQSCSAATFRFGILRELGELAMNLSSREHLHLARGLSDARQAENAKCNCECESHLNLFSMLFRTNDFAIGSYHSVRVLDLDDVAFFSIMMEPQ
jgi:hypothetical protein